MTSLRKRFLRFCSTCAHGETGTLQQELPCSYLLVARCSFLLKIVSFKPVKSWWFDPTVRKGSNLRSLSEVVLLNILCDDRRKK